MTPKLHLGLAAMALAVAPVQEAWSDSFAFDIVAARGDLIPGSTTETFASLGGGEDGPALNEFGALAFRALTTAGEGVFATRDGILKVVAHTGNSVPGTESTFTDFHNPNLNDRGDIAFFAEFNGIEGVFATRSGRLRTVAKLGDPVPGSSSVETFTAFVDLGEDAFDRLEGSIPLLNNAGDVAFRGLFDGGEGIFITRGDELQVVARTDDRVPNSANLETFTEFSLPVLNDRGQVAFTASFGDASGVFLTRGRKLRAVALTGQPVEGVTFGGFSRPALNKAGDVAFSAVFGASRGVFVTRGGRLRTVLQSLDSLPGSSDLFLFLVSRPALNDRGDIAFEAVFVDGGAGVDPLLLARRRGIEIIHQEESGEPTMFEMVLNRRSEIAFVLSDISSFLLVTRGKEPQRVPADNTLEFRPGDVRGLERADLLSGDASFVYAGNGDGLASGFNNKGQVSFEATSEFPSFDEAIVLATPEKDKHTAHLLQ